MLYVLTDSQQTGRDWCRENGRPMSVHSVRILSGSTSARGLELREDDETVTVCAPGRRIRADLLIDWGIVENMAELRGVSVRRLRA